MHLVYRIHSLWLYPEGGYTGDVISAIWQAIWQPLRSRRLAWILGVPRCRATRGSGNVPQVNYPQTDQCSLKVQ